jgi:hypothetical protein
MMETSNGIYANTGFDKAGESRRSQELRDIHQASVGSPN